VNKESVKITDTIFRDAHQSLLATRMRIEDMLAVASKIDTVGYHSLEMWGGATFDSCLRYLNEDPWERLRKLRKALPNTSLQMLLRGQNLLGYRQYPDDVVREFVKKSIKNGINIIRIFDALNDTRNMEVSLKAVKEFGGHAQAAIVYTTSPVHNVDLYVDLAKKLETMGADSICIKDMAGLLRPYDAFELVSRLKQAVSLPIQVHSHYTSGLAGITYMKAVEAGASIIDTALSALAMGTSQPATETMVAVFAGTEYDTGFDLNFLTEINNDIKDLLSKYKAFSKPMNVDTRMLVYQIPGGMLSNLQAQLASQNMLNRLEDVLEEVPRVRAELGYPPLVTPMSQIVGTQAVFNVITGQRYAVKSKEIKDYVRGLYGKSPAPISDEIRKMIIGDEEVLTVRPAELLEPRLVEARNEIRQYIRQDEDVLTYIAFPEVALEFFQKRS
jgi:oxaloacetate decarboxylase alpha subunit